MNSKVALKAFTITEILIVLVITSIIVSLALGSLNMIQQHIVKFRDTKNLHNEAVLLHQQLLINFSEASEVIWDNKKEILLFVSPVQNKQVSIDSLSLSKKKLFLKKAIKYYQGKIVTKGAIDAIELSFGNKEIKQPMFVYKRNDLATHLKYGD